MSRNLKDAENHYEQAYTLVRAELERRARKILREHPNLKGFSMGMGSWCFWDKNDNIVNGQYTGQKYVKPIEDLLAEWDSVLKLTGDPMEIKSE